MGEVGEGATASCDGCMSRGGRAGKDKSGQGGRCLISCAVQERQEEAEARSRGRERLTGKHTKHAQGMVCGHFNSNLN